MTLPSNLTLKLVLVSFFVCSIVCAQPSECPAYSADELLARMNEAIGGRRTLEIKTLARFQRVGKFAGSPESEGYPYRWLYQFPNKRWQWSDESGTVFGKHVSLWNGELGFTAWGGGQDVYTIHKSETSKQLQYLNTERSSQRELAEIKALYLLRLDDTGYHPWESDVNSTKEGCVYKIGLMQSQNNLPGRIEIETMPGQLLVRKARIVHKFMWRGQLQEPVTMYELADFEETSGVMLPGTIRFTLQGVWKDDDPKTHRMARATVVWEVNPAVAPGFFEKPFNLADGPEMWRPKEDPNRVRLPRPGHD